MESKMPELELIHSVHNHKERGSWIDEDTDIEFLLNRETGKVIQRTTEKVDNPYKDASDCVEVSEKVLSDLEIPAEVREKLASLLGE